MESARNLLLLIVPGLSVRLLQNYRRQTSYLSMLGREGFMTPVVPIFPAIYPALEATYLTGMLPAMHGISSDSQVDLVARGLRENRQVADPAKGWIEDRLTLWHRARRRRPELAVASLGELPTGVREQGSIMRRVREAGESLLIAYQESVVGVPLVDGNRFSRAMAPTMESFDADCFRLAQACKAAGRAFCVIGASALTPVSRCLDLGREVFGREAPQSVLFARSYSQIQHIYAAPQEVPDLLQRLRALDCLERVLTGDDLEEFALNHPTAGNIVAVARRDIGFWPGESLDRFKPPMRPPSCSHGHVAEDPLDRPVMIGVGFEQSKALIGACEVAGILDRVLTGVAVNDKA
ncbi:hypothetical protein EDM80_03085 [bacterium]|nr:MAG: hypothetical protein EDM80_03085 [bacterium]RIK65050.1 MAG: hypothetical protein DCC64_02995 [Planctomycetota bacterium]